MNLTKVIANDKFILESGNKCKAAWTVSNSLYDRQSSNSLPTSITTSDDEFNEFFVNVCSNRNPKHDNTQAAT